jgi:hypothetical protein
MAHGAVFRFEVIHRHFEHIVAADANAVNLRLRLAVGGLFGLVFSGMCLAHGGILSRLACAISPASAGAIGGIRVSRVCICLKCCWNFAIGLHRQLVKPSVTIH